MALLSGKWLIREMKTTKLSACLALCCLTAYQFSNVVVGQDELCEAGQSLFQVLTNPTEEEQKTEV